VETTIDLGGGEYMTLRHNEGISSVESEVRVEEVEGQEVGHALFNACINGIECLLLGLIAEGVDVTSPAIHDAARSAVEAAGNEYL